MEKPSTPNKKRMISELIKGRDSTKKLLNLLRGRLVNDGSVSTEDLVMNILGPFSNSLSALSSWGSGGLAPVPETPYAGSADRKPTPVVKNRRGCYKRRDKEDSRIKVVDTIEDEYAWKKYGQKEILDSKFPRCYFRCKHKNKGCKALKQAQKLEDGSQMFHVTYFGYHTCQKRPKNTQMFLDSKALSSFLLNSEDPKINHSSNSLSTITNVNITPSIDQEVDLNSQIDDCLASGYHGKSSIASWKGINSNLELSHDDFFKGVASIDDLKFD